MKAKIQEIYSPEFRHYTQDIQSSALATTTNIFKNLIESKINSCELPKYLDVELSKDLIRELKDLKDNYVGSFYYSQKKRKKVEVNAFNRLNLPADFNLEKYINTILANYDASFIE